MQETTVLEAEKELSPETSEDVMPPTTNKQKQAAYVCPYTDIPKHSGKAGHQERNLDVNELSGSPPLLERHVDGDIHHRDSTLQIFRSNFECNQNLKPKSVRSCIKPSLLTEKDAQLEKYICPKCDCILHDAVQTSCGHWLCNGCAKELFDKKETTPDCPRVDCGEKLTTEEGRPFFPDRFVRKEINRFSMMCPNRKFGCEWNGKIGKLSEHLGSCVYEEECPHCKEDFLLFEYQSHVQICPKATVTCPLKDHGCKETKEMSREECIEHVTSKTGIYSHMLMIASILSSLAPTSSTDAQEGDRRSYAESDGGYESMSKVRSASPKAMKRYISTDGPDPSGNDLGFSEDRVVAGAVGGGGCGDMGEGRVDDKLMSLVMTKITGIQAELTKKDSQIHTLQDKVAQLETTLSTKMSENEDRDFRLSLMENSNFDGSMVWKIPQFSQRMDDARTGKYTSIFSLPFYSSRYGYKMCLRLYILGDGIGKGTHMSLFFVVMKGEFDNILQWPFTHKVTFKLINQCGARDIMDIFQPDPLSSSFQKPKSDMNVASGCPRFVSMNELMQGGFIVDDTIFIKVKVDVPSVT